MASDQLLKFVGAYFGALNRPAGATGRPGQAPGPSGPKRTQTTPTPKISGSSRGGDLIFVPVIHLHEGSWSAPIPTWSRDIPCILQTSFIFQNSQNPQKLRAKTGFFAKINVKIEVYVSTFIYKHIERPTGPRAELSWSVKYTKVAWWSWYGCRSTSIMEVYYRYKYQVSTPSTLVPNCRGGSFSVFRFFYHQFQFITTPPFC